MTNENYQIEMKFRLKKIVGLGALIFGLGLGAFTNDFTGRLDQNSNNLISAGILVATFATLYQSQKMSEAAYRRNYQRL